MHSTVSSILTKLIRLRKIRKCVDGKRCFGEGIAGALKILEGTMEVYHTGRVEEKHRIELIQIDTTNIRSSAEVRLIGLEKNCGCQNRAGPMI